MLIDPATSSSTVVSPVGLNSTVMPYVDLRPAGPYGRPANSRFAPTVSGTFTLARSAIVLRFHLSANFFVTV